MSLLHKKEGPLKLLKNPKSTFYRIWSVFGGVSNLLPISADYSLKSQIGIGKNWVGPPPNLLSLYVPNMPQGSRHTDKSRSSRYRDIGNLAVAIAISGR